MNLQELELARIAESPTNPRKYFDEDELRELANSIKQQGVLQPVVVRKTGPRPNKRSGNHPPTTYELVVGARRYRASWLCGQKNIPAVIRDLSDAEVLELQLLENQQRQDVRPLEEADAMAMLVEKHGRDAVNIADRLGRPVDFVRRRLSLSRLIEPLRELLEDDRIGIGSAQQLASLPTNTQTELAGGDLSPETRVKSWVEGEWTDIDTPRQWDAREVQFAIERVSRDLSSASWAHDLDGLADKPACSGCMKRSDTQTALFETTSRRPRCLDGACWAAKEEAWLENRRAEIKSAGLELLEGDAADDALRWNAEFRHADIRCKPLYDSYSAEQMEAAKEAGADKLTWGDIAPDAKRTWVLDQHNQLHEMIHESAVTESLSTSLLEGATELREYLVERQRPQEEREAERTEQQELERVRREQAAAQRQEQLIGFVDRVEREGIGPFVDVLVELATGDELYMFAQERVKKITKRRTGEAEKSLDNVLEQLDENGRAGVLLEYQLTPCMQPISRAEARWQELVKLVQFPLGTPATQENAPEASERTGPAREILELIQRGETLLPGRLEAQNVKVLREVLLSLRGSLFGASKKQDLVRTILRVVSDDAERGAAE